MRHLLTLGMIVMAFVLGSMLPYVPDRPVLGAQQALNIEDLACVLDERCKEQNALQQWKQEMHELMKDPRAQENLQKLLRDIEERLRISTPASSTPVAIP